MAIPEDMSRFLARKYNLLQQEADARTKGAEADASLASARTALLPGQVAAQNALLGAQAQAAQTQAQLAPLELGFQNRLRDAQIGELGAQTAAREAALRDATTARPGLKMEQERRAWSQGAALGLKPTSGGFEDFWASRYGGGMVY